MSVVSDAAVCLRVVPFSESSQILTFFTRDHGVVRLMAKGALRRTRAGASAFDGGVDLLDCGSAVFTHAPERSLPPLTAWKLTNSFRELRTSLRAIHLAMYAAELVQLLLEEHDPHPAAYLRLVRMLENLSSDRREEEFLAFLLDLLRESGLQPVLTRCASCGAEVTRRTRFSPARGGLICEKCRKNGLEGMYFDPVLAKIIATVESLPRVDGQAVRLPRLSTTQIDQVHGLLAAHLSHVLSRQPRLVRWVVPRRQSVGGGQPRRADHAG
jgi:DNA repair protein RecO (recombination protein O)